MGLQTRRLSRLLKQAGPDIPRSTAAALNGRSKKDTTGITPQSHTSNPGLFYFREAQKQRLLTQSSTDDATSQSRRTLAKNHTQPGGMSEGEAQDSTYYYHQTIDIRIRLVHARSLPARSNLQTRNTPRTIAPDIPNRQAHARSTDHGPFAATSCDHINYTKMIIIGGICDLTVLFLGII